MSSPCPITRSMRWRVRDWASCFYACRLPLVHEERQEINCAPSAPVTATFHNRKPDRRRRDSRNTKAATSISSDRGPWSEEIKEATHQSSASADSSSRRTHSTEDDYIVFCFKENGEIHVEDTRMSGGGSDDHNNINSANTSSSNQVLQKGRGKGDDNSNMQRPEDEEMKEIRDVEETNESTGSNPSDGSSSSFAFPVLGWEFMGSPIKMPHHPEDADLGKSKARCVRLQCCRF